jgi:hypothetical protein
MPDYPPTELGIYALYVPNRYLAAKTRVLIDFLVARFGETPEWDGFNPPTIPDGAMRAEREQRSEPGSRRTSRASFRRTPVAPPAARASGMMGARYFRFCPAASA